MLPNRLVHFRRPIIVAIHLALFSVGYLAAFQLRFDFRLPPRHEELFWATVPFLVALRLITFERFGLFRNYWRHFGLRDLSNMAKAATTSTALFVAVLALLESLGSIPRAVIVLDWVAAIFLPGGLRFAARYIREGEPPTTRKAGKRTLIIGAGDAAAQLLRHGSQRGRAGIRPIGLVDDDPLKRNMSLHGVPVLGTTANLEHLVARYRIELLVIAIPSATGEQTRRIVERCVMTGVEFKILPSLQELLDGRRSPDELRNVELEDLLGREAVTLDLSHVERDIAGKVVLITGGAGSIGSELARQVARFAPRRLILMEQAESPLYFIQLELARDYPELEVVPIIGSVADEARLREVFASYLPQYVFHAAAYKHVPMMEVNPAEAVRNNVFGTLRVAQAAADHGTGKFVLISTDKAVNPSSIMGATKRIAERIVLGWPTLRSSRTDLRAVRFGNVLGSSGSVVPLFKQQLAAGGPLTVTHPEVTRYFMTIPEAVQLVLQAAALPEAAGRVAMLEMGEPVRITDLAEKLVRLSGLEPYRDVPIVFTGLRPGEKLHEELMSAVEATVPTAIDKIRVVQTDEPEGTAVEQGLDRLATALMIGSQDDLVREICALVPECVEPLRGLVTDEPSTSRPPDLQVRTRRTPQIVPAA